MCKNLAMGYLRLNKCNYNSNNILLCSRDAEIQIVSMRGVLMESDNDWILFQIMDYLVFVRI
jgi:hypothetical protein